MVSSFGWLDTDNEQRRKMLEVVDLFKEEGTVDELGIGSIRDAFADALFPGTSVLQTRLRYILFIPWLMQEAARGNRSATEMSARFRESELQLIYALSQGEEKLGVIGNTARAKLKRMPSSMYWAAMGTWNIRNGDLSPEAYFRRQYDYRRLANRTARADDPEVRDLLVDNDLDPHLPSAPAGWLGRTNFELRPEEEQYLSDVISASRGDSMLAWLIRNEADNLPDYVWQVDNIGAAPEPLQNLIDHARRFHTVIYGAAVLYNLLLARKTDRDELVAEYEAQLPLWRDEMHATQALDDWSRSEWWAAVHRCNPRLRQATKNFVNSWIDLAASDVDLTTDSTAAKLISSRERQIKGGRARLMNQAALDRWSGRSGLSRLDYRWSVARRHLRDLYDARAAA
ncbi:DUF6361 family protein [Mycolicibacterium septicum]|uniref:DUF6361 family protein n=1 Tax=Mycolicibacterium septicum TaxID=98668 RepID=UPI001AF2F7A3|nr:DUF6361 family protein [Mycolicibacterium septicum]QRY53803.1 hypothetical protein JVX95_11035 [Mycolicibacterium septicum]